MDIVPAECSFAPRAAWEFPANVEIPIFQLLNFLSVDGDLRTVSNKVEKFPKVQSSATMQSVMQSSLNKD